MLVNIAQFMSAGIYKAKSVFKKLKDKILIIGASLVTQTVKNPPAMQETWVQSLNWEDLQ